MLIDKIALILMIIGGLNWGLIGIFKLDLVALLCGGQSLYIPKRESLERNARDRDIRARFNGCNYRALAVQFRLSERQIRKIINGTRT